MSVDARVSPYFYGYKSSRSYAIVPQDTRGVGRIWTVNDVGSPVFSFRETIAVVLKQEAPAPEGAEATVDLPRRGGEEDQPYSEYSMSGDGSNLIFSFIFSFSACSPSVLHLPWRDLPAGCCPARPRLPLGATASAISSGVTQIAGKRMFPLEALKESPLFSSTSLVISPGHAVS